MSLMQMANQGGTGGTGGTGGGGTPPAKAEGGAPDGTKPPEGGTGGSEGGGAPEGQGGAEKKDFKTARPDNVPEKFWDADVGVVKTDDVLKSYINLEKELTKAKEKPKAPDKYEININEEITKKHPNLKVEDFAGDDSVKSFHEHAKKQGYTQEQADSWINWYIQRELDAGEARAVSEFGKLGDQAKAVERVKALNHFAATKLTPAEKSTMESLTRTAAGVALFEKLISLSTGQRQIVTEDPETVSPRLTQSDIDDMMKDERYNNKRHPEYESWNQKVTAAYESLYGNK